LAFVVCVYNQFVYFDACTFTWIGNGELLGKIGVVLLELGANGDRSKHAERYLRSKESKRAPRQNGQGIRHDAQKIL
jgi:hypothetical protein